MTGHNDFVCSVVISPDGERIFSGSSDKSIGIWDLRTGKPKVHALTGHTRRVLGVAITQNGRLIASASDDGTLRMWDARTGKSVGKHMRFNSHDRYSSHAISFSPDSSWLAAASEDNTVCIWDVVTQLPLSTKHLKCEAYPFAVVFSQDGRLLAAGCANGYIHLWRASSRPAASEQRKCAIDRLFTIWDTYRFGWRRQIDLHLGYRHGRAGACSRRSH